MLFSFELSLFHQLVHCMEGEISFCVIELPLYLLWKDVCPTGAGLVVACTDGFVVGWHLYPHEILQPSPGACGSPADLGQTLGNCFIWSRCLSRCVTDPASAMLLTLPPNVTQTHLKY